MNLKKPMRAKLSLVLKLAVALSFLAPASALAQASRQPIFDAPWRGFDTGTFNAATLDSGFLPTSFAVGDLDGDGDVDVLVGDSFGNCCTGVSVLKNNGDKTFAPPIYYALAQGNTVGEVALADYDGDGDLDAFAAIRGNFDQLTSIRVWRNNGDGTFAASTSFTTGQGPLGIVVADFTNDGKPDVATANAGGHSISLLVHNGQIGASAGYLAPVNFALQTSPERIAAGDVNADGKLDLAVSRFDGASSVLFSVFINAGNGNFAAPIDYQSAPDSSSFSYAIALRDLDKDGDADLMGGGRYSVGSGGSGALTIRRGNGSGVFGDAEIYQFETNYGSMPWEITTGDINGDGWVDIISAIPSGRGVEGFETLLSNGAGGFQTPKYYEASQQTYDVAAFDVDRDGDSDVVTLANASTAVTVHENTGNGTFRVPVRYNVASLSDAVENADIDNDGDIDVVVNGEVNVASNSAVVKILKNNGNGTFAPAISYTPPRNFADMKLRDINNDGFVDLVFAPDDNFPSYHLGTALNNGDGTFAPTVVRQLFACGGGTIDAVDLDGDSDRDLVFVEELTCQSTNPRIFVFRNDGNQNFFQMPTLAPPGLPHGLTIADVTSDGKLDLITAVSGSMEVFPGNGNLTFSAPILSTSEPYKFTTADFNSDGKLDLGMIMAQDSFTDRIATALGNGNGTFQPIRTQVGSTVLETLRISSDLEAADYNGDGKVDLLTINYASNDVSLFLNAGDGALLPQQRYGVGNTPHLATVADFNGDGKPDLAAAIGLPPLGLQDAIVVLRNSNAPPQPRRAPFDFDGDGKTDNAIYHPADGNWDVLNSSTANHTTRIWGASADKIVPADYDGDGKTDIAVFRPSEGNWYILQSSNGSATVQGWGGSGDLPVPADYDGDGRADVAVYRPAEGNWYIRRSSNSSAIVQGWGASGDVPVSGDYDGDGRADIAVFRPSEGNWYVIQSSTGTATLRNWGMAGDYPAPGDYDGDGKSDLAVFRPSEGNWYLVPSAGNSATVRNWGMSGDMPVPGDYDGDGRTDIAVYRSSESNWYVVRSSTNAGNLGQLGTGGDRPVPAAYIQR